MDKSDICPILEIVQSSFRRSIFLPGCKNAPLFVTGYFSERREIEVWRPVVRYTRPNSAGKRRLMARWSQLTAWVTLICGRDCGPGVLAPWLAVGLGILAACYSPSVLNRMWAVAAVGRRAPRGCGGGRFLKRFGGILCTDKSRRQ